MAETIELPQRPANAVLASPGDSQAALTDPPPTEPQVNEAEDESKYPKGWSFWIVFINCALIMIFTGLDGSMIATAVPSITDEFQTILDVGWYYSAFRLCLCAFQFVFGKLYQVFTIKPVLTTSIAIFMVGNIVSATAPSSKALIVGRAIAGFGASGITAGMFMLLTVGVPVRKRPLYGAAGAAIELVSTTSGPVLGGIITQNLSWRWCFWITLPFGGASFIVALLYMWNPDTAFVDTSLSLKEKIRKLELLSSVFFVPCITALLLALQWGGHEYGWSSPQIISLFVVFGVLFMLFVWQQWRRGDEAMLPPRIITQRSIMFGALFSFCIQSVVGVVDYYLPIYLQTAKLRTPSQSGVQVLPMIGGILTAVAVVGPLITAIGYYTPFMLAASILSPIAAGLLTTLKYDTAMGKIYAMEVFIGLSMGIGLQGPQIVSQICLPPKDTSMGLAIILFTQNAGPMLAVSIAQTIFTGRLKSDVYKYAPHSNGTAFGLTGFSDVRSQVGTDSLSDLLTAYAKAVTETYYLPVAFACVSLIGALGTEWRSVKKKQE